MINNILTGLSVLLKNSTVLNRPLHLQVEPSTLCNLQCKFCISVLKLSGKKLTMDKFKYFITSAKPQRCTFSGRGEPMLNPELPQMIQYCKSKNISTTITTNFTIKQMVKDLVQSGIETIRISIDAAKRETYLKIRGKDRFGTILEGIETVNRLRKGKKARPFLVFEYVMLDDNFGEISELLDLAHKLQINCINFRPLQVYDGISNKVGNLIGNIVGSSDTIDRLTEFLNKAKMKGVSTNLKEVILDWHNYVKRQSSSVKKSGGNKMCILPWLQCFVSAEGEITPCCSIFDNEGESFGNVFEKDFFQIWNGEKFKEIRETFKNKQIIYKSCESCPSKGMGFIFKKALAYKFFKK
ncbi:SPASM domain-containing protein [bacterium]|nr:SPASM domain-containing protein [bacterium]